MSWNPWREMKNLKRAIEGCFEKLEDLEGSLSHHRTWHDTTFSRDHRWYVEFYDREGKFVSRIEINEAVSKICEHLEIVLIEEEPRRIVRIEKTPPK